MPTLDVWSNAESSRLPSLFRSLMAMLLLLDSADRPLYFCSPWITDFEVFDNRFLAFDALLPLYAGRRKLMLTDCLTQLSQVQDIRLVTKNTEASMGFLKSPRLQLREDAIWVSDDTLHEKGVLTPIAYLEGSMNITYSGVHVNKEKVSYHSGSDLVVQDRMAKAYLEFERRWRQK